MTAKYHEDPYLKKTEATVLSAFEEDDGSFVVAFDGGIFYPRGGGQSGDRGVIRKGGKEYRVFDTIKDAMSSDNRPLCKLAEPAEDLEKGDVVEVEIDWDHRFAQMRLHSIVHLHHCLMEEALGESIDNPKISDLHDDGTALNRYETKAPTDELARIAAEKMHGLVETGAQIETRDDENKPGFRYWECLGFVIPCGGTHLKDVKEIGGFSYEFSTKKGKPKIVFTLQ